MDRSDDAHYIECAYHYLFGFSKPSELPIFALDVIFLASAPGLSGYIPKDQKGTRAMPLRIKVLLFSADYDSLATGVSGF